MPDLSLIPTSGVRLTILPADGNQISRGRIRLEVDGPLVRAWRRRDVIAEGTPTLVTQQNSRVVEILMEDGARWLTSGCSCGG